MSETYTAWDRIKAERVEGARERSAKPDLCASLTCEELANLIDDLADRVFDQQHQNHAVLKEAAVRLRDY